ncbi:MAG: hypothetical protein ACRBBN_01105 [Methyloligellaceae bacterium]
MRNVSFLPNRIAHPAHEPALINDFEHIEQSFHYWFGASGKRYLHTVYSLLECPCIPKANYILVKSHENGEKSALRIGRTVEDASSLNLAHIRQKAAQLGAGEIHIHVLSDSQQERFITETDLRAGLFSSLSAEAR